MVTTSVQVNIPEEPKFKFNSGGNPGTIGYDSSRDVMATPEPTIGSALGTGGGVDYSTQLENLRQQALGLKQQVTDFYATKPTNDFVYSPYDKGPDQYDTSVDENAIRRATMKMFQGQIDATNQVYDQLLNEARLEGEGRLGSQRAIAARGGILGSDFAGAQKKKVQDFNTDIYRSIGAERRAAIAAIEGAGRQYAQQEIAAKRQARQQDAETYLNFLANKETRTNEWVSGMAQSLLAQGLTPDEVEDTINRAAQDAGVDPMRIKDAFYKLQAGQGADAGDQFTLSSGERRYDAQGNLIAEGAPKQGQIYSTGSGLVRINEDGTPELIFASSGGSGSSTKGSFSSGSLTVPASQVSEMSQYLEESRVNGYVPADSYQEIVNQLVAGGAVLEDIVNRFPPKDYLNPNDSNVPPHLASKLKSGSILDQFGLSPTDVPEATTQTEEEDGTVSGWFKGLLGL